MKLLIHLMFPWMVRLCNPRRWRQPLNALFGIVAIGLICLSPWGVQLSLWGLTVPLPLDNGERTDVIVLLGRGGAFRELRTKVAQELWQAHRVPQIFASGMMDARLIIQSLKKLDVPDRDLSGEECSRSTYENALYTAALIEPPGARHILLVTDAPHMLRSLMIFRRYGFQVVPYAISLPPQWRPIEQQRRLLREDLALIQHTLVGGRAQPISKSLIVAPAEVMEKIQNWNCWVQGAA